MENYKNKLLPILKKHFPHAKIYLFGSRAKGTARSGSDIDVAIDNGNIIDVMLLAKARVEFEDLNIPVNIDLVDFNSVPTGMQEEIIKDGISWIS